MSDAEVQALMKLLGDDDERIAERAARALVERRERSRATVRAAAQQPASDPALRWRLGAVMEEIGWEDLLAAFVRLGAQSGLDVDLEAGLLAIACFGYPDLDTGRVRARLDEWARGLEYDPADPGQALGALNRRLFGEVGLRGNAADYYDPDNSYLNRLLERRLGIPISLACVYLLVGRRIGAPVRGIGLPGHFLAAFQPPGEEARFVDVFDGGRLLSVGDIGRLLERQGLTRRPEFMAAVPDRAILVRCLNNLIGIFGGRGDTRRARFLVGFRDALIAPSSATML